jgi:hypothetical protein
MTPKTIQLWKDMADLTAPECAGVCKLPHSCCSPEYCDMAEEIALEAGVVLSRTDHPTLKYMGSTGCVVEPHWRPLCTLHTCDVNSFGFKRGDEAWTKRYFKLRERIDRAMYEESK